MGAGYLLIFKRSIMIVAYFETNSTAEIAGKYSSEEEYLKDLPRLENLAETLGFTRITESIE